MARSKNTAILPTHIRGMHDEIIPIEVADGKELGSIGLFENEPDAQITIAEDAGEWTEETLIHEILHYCCVEAGVEKKLLKFLNHSIKNGDVKSNKAFFIRRLEELFVEAVDGPLIAVLKKNKIFGT